MKILMDYLLAIVCIVIAGYFMAFLIYETYMMAKIAHDCGKTAHKDFDDGKNKKEDTNG